MTDHQHLKTLGTTPFGLYGPAGKHMFRVNPDIPASAALEYISMLQNCINELNLDYAMGDRNLMAGWATYYLGEMSKALVDDLNEAAIGLR
jgi:hypothetical protein